jgi:hypothetical protein
MVSDLDRYPIVFRWLQKCGFSFYTLIYLNALVLFSFKREKV